MSKVLIVVSMFLCSCSIIFDVDPGEGAGDPGLMDPEPELTEPESPIPAYVELRINMAMIDYCELAFVSVQNASAMESADSSTVTRTRTAN